MKKFLFLCFLILPILLFCSLGGSASGQASAFASEGKYIRLYSADGTEYVDLTETKPFFNADTFEAEESAMLNGSTYTAAIIETDCLTLYNYQGGSIETNFDLTILLTATDSHISCSKGFGIKNITQDSSLTFSFSDNTVSLFVDIDQNAMGIVTSGGDVVFNEYSNVSIGGTANEVCGINTNGGDFSCLYYASVLIDLSNTSTLSGNKTVGIECDNFVSNTFGSVYVDVSDVADYSCGLITSQTSLVCADTVYICAMKKRNGGVSTNDITVTMSPCAVTTRSISTGVEYYQVMKGEGKTVYILSDYYDGNNYRKNCVVSQYHFPAGKEVSLLEDYHESLIFDGYEVISGERELTLYDGADLGTVIGSAMEIDSKDKDSLTFTMPNGNVILRKVYLPSFSEGEAPTFSLIDNGSGTLSFETTVLPFTESATLKYAVVNEKDIDSSLITYGILPIDTPTEIIDGAVTKEVFSADFPTGKYRIAVSYYNGEEGSWVYSPSFGIVYSPLQADENNIPVIEDISVGTSIYIDITKCFIGGFGDIVYSIYTGTVPTGVTLENGIFSGTIEDSLFLNYVTFMATDETGAEAMTTLLFGKSYQDLNELYSAGYSFSVSDTIANYDTQIHQATVSLYRWGMEVAESDYEVRYYKIIDAIWDNEQEDYVGTLATTYETKPTEGGIYRIFIRIKTDETKLEADIGSPVLLISRYDIRCTEISLEYTSATYQGKGLTPSVTAKFDADNDGICESLLRPDKDYRLEYENNENVGQATVRVVGQNSFSDEYLLYFEIEQVSPTIVLSQNYYYMLPDSELDFAVLDDFVGGLHGEIYYGYTGSLLFTDTDKFVSGKELGQATIYLNSYGKDVDEDGYYEIDGYFSNDIYITVCIQSSCDVSDALDTSKINIAGLVNGKVAYSGQPISFSGNASFVTEEGFVIQSGFEYQWCDEEKNVINGAPVYGGKYYLRILLSSAVFSGKTYIPFTILDGYYVAFDGNGNTNEVVMTKIGALCEEGFSLPVATYKKKGFSLIGWSRERDGEIAFSDGQQNCFVSATKGETVTLYAVWGKCNHSDNINEIICEHTYTCSECGEEIYFAHDYGKAVPKKEATASQNGYIEHYCCSKCGQNFVFENDTYTKVTVEEITLVYIPEEPIIEEPDKKEEEVPEKKDTEDKTVVQPEKKTLSGGAIAGIVIGCVVAVAGATVGTIFGLKKKKPSKKKNVDNQEEKNE